MSFLAGRSSVVAFCGSRGVPGSAAPLVGAVVSSVLGSGRRVAVGCARGADALVVRAVLAAGVSAARLSVFAVGGSCGSGFWAGSAVPAVVAASRAGALVSWWAGGAASVPLRARLAARSRACFRAALGSSRPGVVAFVSGGFSASPGSWSSVRFALRSCPSVPVVVFPVGCSVSCFPRSFAGVGRGSWVPAASSGVWASGFRWVPSG